jgi:hypothetical protein
LFDHPLLPGANVQSIPLKCFQLFSKTRDP